MVITNSKIYKNKTKELSLDVLAQDLALIDKDKRCLKDNVRSFTILVVIDKEIAKPDCGVESIYLIELDVKSDMIPITIMTAFDKQTAAHTIFEVPWYGEDEYGNKAGRYWLYYMSNKVINDGKISMGNYYGTDPDMTDLFINIKKNESLGDIYANLYSYVVGLHRRPGETATDIESRSKAIKKIEKQMAQLERQKCTEKQFQLQKQIDELL
jgi:hypothetical protein